MTEWKHLDGKTLLEAAIENTKAIAAAQNEGLNVEGIGPANMGRLDIATSSDVISCPKVSDLPTLDQKGLTPPPTKIWCDQCACDIWYPRGHEGSKARKLCRACASAFVRAHRDDYREEPLS